MEIIVKLRELLLKDRASLILSIERAKEARDKAPSATESHSDTTRSQNEKLVAALEENLKDLDSKISQLPKSLPKNENSVSIWSKVELQINGNNMNVLVVPEGYGGKKIDSIITLTQTTPLGKAILNKSSGQNYVINGQTGTISVISSL